MKKYIVIHRMAYAKSFVIIFLLLSGLTAAAQTATAQSERIQYNNLVLITAQQQYPAVRPGSKSAIAVHFELNEGWHFYADEETAPGGMNLKIKPQGKGLKFSNPIFPKSEAYFDKAIGQLKVYSGKFTVLVPFEVEQIVADEEVTVDVKINIEAAICSADQCQLPSFQPLVTKVRIRPDAAMDNAAFELPTFATSPGQPLSLLPSLLLAFVAGLTLNIMPCVWPVIPIIVMRLLNQAQKSVARSVGLGLAFCGGILLFFVALAVVNIVLRAGFGTIFQWGDHFRNPAFLIAMALLMVVLAMFMFGAFNIAIPASVAGKGGNGRGYLGSVGMGFIAAILATPCSFAILTAAFAWAQTQPLFLSTLAIMLIGAGMAMPYAVLTAIPSLLQRMPKPGRWMEIFKQALGFILLFIAVKLIEALPGQQRTGILFYALVLGFCVWMWGTWVSYNTSSLRKWMVRLIALAIAVAAGFWLLPQKHEPIDWQDYNPSMINQATVDNRPVLLEFMADWCLSCKTVEKTVYNRRDIAKLIKDKAVLAIRADTTLKDYPATIDLRDVYHEPAVPVSILIVPGEAEPIRFHGILIGEKLKEQLTKLPDKVE